MDRILGRCFKMSRSIAYRPEISAVIALYSEANDLPLSKIVDDYQPAASSRLPSSGHYSVAFMRLPTSILPTSSLIMESMFTCLSCSRALTRASKTSSGKRIAQHLWASQRTLATVPPTRELTSNARFQSNFQCRTPPQRPVRAASTAAAPAKEEDNFERHNQLPNDYGSYTPSAYLRGDNLFHPFSKSPIPQMRQRAAFTKQHAYCPHPIHRQTRLPSSPNDPEARKLKGSEAQAPAHVEFECPDCGIATYCSEKHWADDYESHLEICDILRQINEDDHDLRSGRWFPEFEYPGPQLDEILVNMTTWDTLLYTRGFEAINEDRAMRQATRLLTYPVTIGSVLHELSPYDIRRGGRLTVEGLKSLSGLSSIFLHITPL